MSEEEKKFLEIVDLKKGFGSGETRQEVLRGMNFSVAKGEFCVLLGPSGSGKSTFAKHLNALLIPTEGTLFVNGMDTSDYNNDLKIRQTAGMVFQNPDNQIISNLVEEDV